MKNDYDADDDTSFEENGGVRSMTVLIVVLLVVVGFFAFAWYAYRSNSTAASEEAEVIHAEPGPVKDKPKDPGGINIPYQDMSVYNALSEKGAKKDERKVEKLLPEPEEPIANAAPTQGAKATAEPNIDVFIKGEPADGTSAPAVKALDAAVAKTGSPSADQAAAKKAALASALPSPAPVTTPPVTKPADASESNHFMDKSVQTPPTKKETSPATAAPAAGSSASGASGSTQVQLAALKSTGEAEKTWMQIKSRFPTPLAGKTHSIVKADLPSGTFYRLRVGGFAPDAAKKLCSDLAAKKQPCMIVH